MAQIDPFEIDLKNLPQHDLQRLFEDLLAESMDIEEQAEYVEGEIRRRKREWKRKSK